jgi:transposase
MRKITEVLRLKFEAKLSHDQVACAVGLSKGVVGKYVSLAKAQGLSWPLPEGMDEAALEARLYPPRQAQVFVAVLGASSYTYAEATWTQELHQWIASHQRAFAFFGGVVQLLVPDNLLSAVTKACRYDPQPNATYQELARHYGCAILPARPYMPKDKSKAEVGVQVVERWILARLRHHTFFSLSELNAAIRELLTELNTRPFQKLPGSRRSAFEALDKPALKPLPATGEVVKRQLQDLPHPEHGYRRCLGLLNHARRYGKERLEAACERALAIH